MKIDDDFLKQVSSLGILNYNSEKCSILLDIDIEEFEANEEIQKAYEKGVLMGEYEIDIRLFEMAKSGDLAALKEFEKRKKDREDDF